MRNLFCTVIFFVWGMSAALGQQYQWPTDSGTYLSSTFGETRSQHFHAGLDIKTWGREGYRVFAARDGILHRLVVTERGYGNAIYLKHPDDTYTVYAHLQRFNADIQALVDSIRLQDYSFEMDATFSHRQIPIQKGDVIGYTGSTGIGPPHLHFEIRDSLQNPINALKSNLSEKIKDTRPPVFSSLIVEPLNKNSRVNQKAASHYIRRKKTENEVYNFGTVNLHGKAGLAVNVFDQADDVHNAYAVYSLALLHQKDTLFYQKLNSFSFDHDGEMYLDRIAPFGSDRRGHQRLYAKEGATNPFHITAKEAAELAAADTTQTYHIIARDYFGNEAKARVTIAPDTVQPADTTAWHRSTKNWYWSENWASPDLKNTIDLTDGDLGVRWRKHQQLIFKDSSNYLQLARIYPGEAQKVQTPDQRLRLRFGAHAFYDTLSIVPHYNIRGHEVHLSVQPQMLAAKNEFGIEFYLGEMADSMPSRYRLFRKELDGDLSYVDSRQIGRTLHAYPSQPGEFIIKADTTAPVIDDFRIIQTNYGKWQATVMVTDEESGIESSSAQFWVNGIRGIAEYDYEKDVLTYHLQGFSPESENTAEVYIEDKAGNHTHITFTP